MGSVPVAWLFQILLFLFFFFPPEELLLDLELGSVFPLNASLCSLVPWPSHPQQAGSFQGPVTTSEKAEGIP